MCALQNTPVYINYQTVKQYIYSNGDLELWSNDPKINRVLPRLQGNNVVKFGKDPKFNICNVNYTFFQLQDHGLRSKNLQVQYTRMRPNFFNIIVE
jgi:hypothetical protein